MQMNGLGGKSGWRWIFIMEGIVGSRFTFRYGFLTDVIQMTVLIGIAGYWLLVDFPDGRHKSWHFLNQREKQFIIDRVERDRGDSKLEPFTLGRFLRPALDLKIWGFAMCFLWASPATLYSTGLES